MIEVRALSYWDVGLLQTRFLQPSLAVSRVLEWTIEPHPIDAAPPVALAIGIAGALVRFGRTAFRWGYPAAPLLAPGDQLVTGSRRMFRGRSVPILMTNQGSQAARAFEWQWDLQGQAVLVFARDEEPPAETIHQLSTRVDWRTFEIVPPLRLFMAPVTDGYGALIACRDEADLDALDDALRRCLAEQGIHYTSAAGS